MFLVVLAASLSPVSIGEARGASFLAQSQSDGEGHYGFLGSPLSHGEGHHGYPLSDGEGHHGYFGEGHHGYFGSPLFAQGTQSIVANTLVAENNALEARGVVEELVVLLLRLVLLLLKPSDPTSVLYYHYFPFPSKLEYGSTLQNLVIKQ